MQTPEGHDLWFTAVVTVVGSVITAIFSYLRGSRATQVEMLRFLQSGMKLLITEQRKDSEEDQQRIKELSAALVKAEMKIHTLEDNQRHLEYILVREGIELPPRQPD